VKTGRFHFLFDNSSGQQQIHDKYAAVQSIEQFRFFTTKITTLSYSLQLGVSGFCDIAANVYPDLLGIDSTSPLPSCLTFILIFSRNNSMA